MTYPDDFIDKVICGDCFEVMKAIPDNSVDLTVTSPPYDNLRTYDGYEFRYKDVITQLYRITKVGGIVVWVVGDMTVNGSETGTSFRQALCFLKNGFNIHDTMIYAKTCIYPDENRYLGCFEYMFIVSKGNPKTVNFIKDRMNKSASKNTPSSYRQKDGSTQWKIPKQIKPYGRRTNIWYYDTGYQKSTRDQIAFQHPATFPEKLAQDHIISWSNKDDIVLDPMCGSGTVCKMAKISERKYIGIDISPSYCKIARERLMGVPDSLFKEIKKLT